MLLSDIQNFTSFSEITQAFAHEESCISQLETIRWNDDITSPFDAASKIYKCKNGRYRCRNSGKYFNVKTYTIFHNSKLPLQKWFQAIWLTKNTSELTALELSKKLEVTPKTAWLMQKRIAKYVKTQSPKTEKPSQLVLTDWLNQLH